MADPTHLVIGHVSKPHGIKGEVFVLPLTDRPEAMFEAGRTVIAGDTNGELGESPEPLRVEAVRPYRRGLLVRFEGFADRSGVERLARRYLLRPVEELAPLEEDEVFYHQLLDAEVVTTAGEPVGRVREVYDTEPADLLEVRSGDGKLRLVPFTKQVVRSVDRDAKRIVIDPPPGLLEL